METRIITDVVVEPVLNDRPDGHLGLGVELFDRLPEQVTTGMPDDVDPLGVLWRDDLQFRVFGDDIAGIDQLAIDATGNGCLGQTGADIRGDVEYTERLGIVTLTAVRKGNLRHERDAPQW